MAYPFESSIQLTDSACQLIFASGNSYISESPSGQLNVYAGSVNVMTLKSTGMALTSGAFVDTIETTLTDDDTHIPTSGAVYDAINSTSAVWTKSGTNLSPSTAGDDILLNANEQLNFVNANTYIKESTTSMELGTGGSSRLTLGAVNSTLYSNLNPASSSFYNIGNSGTYWNGIYATRFYVAGTTVHIDKDVSDNMMFSDGSNTDVTLSSLVSGGSSISFGSSTQIPYTNVAGDDFLYSSDFLFNGTTDLSIGGSATTSRINLKASGSGYDWELKHDSDGAFKIDYYTSTYLEVTNSGSTIYGGTTKPNLNLYAGSTIISAELGRHPSTIGSYFSGTTDYTVDGALFRPSLYQTQDYTMIYHYANSHGGVFHRQGSSFSDARQDYNYWEWGIGTTTTAWSGNIRMTTGYIQVKGSSTAALYLDSLSSSHDTRIYFREGTSTQFIMGHDAGTSTFQIHSGSSFLTSPDFSMDLSGNANFKGVVKGLGKAGSTGGSTSVSETLILSDTRITNAIYEGPTNGTTCWKVTINYFWTQIGGTTPSGVFRVKLGTTTLKSTVSITTGQCVGTCTFWITPRSTTQSHVHYLNMYNSTQSDMSSQSLSLVTHGTGTGLYVYFDGAGNIDWDIKSVLIEHIGI